MDSHQSTGIDALGELYPCDEEREEDACAQSCCDVDTLKKEFRDGIGIDACTIKPPSIIRSAPDPVPGL